MPLLTVPQGAAETARQSFIAVSKALQVCCFPVAGTHDVIDRAAERSLQLALFSGTLVLNLVLRPVLAAMLLVSFLLLDLPAVAEAQDQVLVSTIGQVNARELLKIPGSPVASGIGLIDHGQSFTTGANAAGYKLSSVEIRFGRISTGLTYTARIQSAGTAGKPSSTVVGTLTTPSFSSSTTGQTLNFAAPSGGGYHPCS